MSSETKTKSPTLQPSKFSLAASEVWSQSKDLLKKTEFKIDLGLDKKDSNEEKKETIPITKGYVFGSKLSERVANPVTTEKQEEDKTKVDDGPKEVSSIFKKFVEKANEKNEDTSNELGPSTSNERFKATMEEFAKKATNGIDKGAAVSITTGEEDEKILFNTNCKFFLFNTETKSWVERGLGYIRLNTKTDHEWDDSEDGIRLVGRITGTQKVVINSKIFPEMVLEKITEKRLKISAQCPDSDLPQLFIVQAAPASIETLHNWIQSYVDRAAMHQIRLSPHPQQQRKRKMEGASTESDDEEDTHKELPKAPKKAL
uniref:RanBD1 domain-containing protein n=1 Tax=Acrobeloides nanus TaxID=290746 RepID=A0A914C7R8_9BILA